ncbi:MAG: twin-arginine translocase subunit TatC [Bacteroides sp.]|nr:MAG: twin-arginine translocase subunit TatC [Bacteroides sp.]
MNFFDHLDILRWSLIRSLIFISIIMLIVFFNNDLFFNKILLYINDPNFWTYKQLNYIGIKTHNVKFNIINTHLFGQVSLHIYTSFVISFIISFPYIIREIWIFIKPALNHNEIKLIRNYLFIAIFLFYLGITFGYYILVPITISFLSTYIVSNSIANTYVVTNYISTIIKMILLNGLIFEIPLLVLFVLKLNLIDINLIYKSRKYIIVLILILSAIITPSPDVVTQIIVAIPLYILYEISILVCIYSKKY